MIINKSPKIEDYSKLPYELEKIDWKQWLVFDRILSYQILNRGFTLRNNILSVRNLRYKNKTFAFEYFTEDNGIIIHLPVMIEENEIITLYLFAVEPIKYENLMKKIYELSINNMGSQCNDEAKKAIIEFLNDIFNTGKVFRNYSHIEFYDNFNPWKISDNSYYDKRRINETVKEFHCDDLVKLTNKETGEKYFGVLKINNRNANEIGNYKCYIIDPGYQYNEYCGRFFLPVNLSRFKSLWEFSKADIDELSNTHKEYYINRYKKGIENE